jgi:hypothetical protein
MSFEIQGISFTGFARMIRRLLVFSFFVWLLPPATWAQNSPSGTWSFAVSGDSRNCGDVVMPAIAKSVLEHKVEFYWHLGDFRLGYAIDEDMQNQSGGQLTVSEYQKKAWDDFLAQQIAPFGSLPVHLGIGNHELYFHGTTEADDELSHAEFIRKFNQWLGGSKTAYYHWKVREVDFISLDNSKNDGFGTDQLAWLDGVLKEDGANKDVKAVVVGMHRALPNSLACGHSMNGDPYSSAVDNHKSKESGRTAYKYLWHFQNTTGKGVYVLASHSHFFMENIFNTPYWNNRNEKDGDILKGENEKQQTTLKGWLIGTAGAVRYRLPDNLPSSTPSISYVYGYLLGEVSSEGMITFHFEQVTENDLPHETKAKYGTKIMDFCFLANRDASLHTPEESCNEQ